MSKKKALTLKELLDIQTSQNLNQNNVTISLFIQLVANLEALKNQTLELPKKIPFKSTARDLITQKDEERTYDASYDAQVANVKRLHNESFIALESFASTLLKKKQPLSKEDQTDLELLNTTILFTVKIKKIKSQEELLNEVKEFSDTHENIKKRLKTLHATKETKEEWGVVLAILGGIVLGLGVLGGGITTLLVSLLGTPAAGAIAGGITAAVIAAGSGLLTSGLVIYNSKHRHSDMQMVEKMFADSRTMFAKLPEKKSVAAANDNDADKPTPTPPPPYNPEAMGDNDPPPTPKK